MSGLAGSMPEISTARLQGKVALVVGGGSTGDYPGTGSAAARLFAAHGARVVVMGRSREPVERTVADIANAGGSAAAYFGDTTRREGCEGAVAAALAAFGQLDVVVNNTAVHKSFSIDNFDEAAWDDAVRGNFTAPLLMSACAAAALRKSSGGSIINIGSIAGTQSTGAIGYGTTKAALEPLTRDLAMALGKDGIRVNCVIPGHMHTPHVDRLAGGKDPNRELRQQLNMLGTEGDGWDIAWAALFLASDEAHFITGQSLVVDGGVTGIMGMAQVMRTANFIRTTT